MSYSAHAGTVGEAIAPFEQLGRATAQPRLTPTQALAALARVYPMAGKYRSSISFGAWNTGFTAFPGTRNVWMFTTGGLNERWDAVIGGKLVAYYHHRAFYAVDDLTGQVIEAALN